jgi:hypothetical protein
VALSAGVNSVRFGPGHSLLSPPAAGGRRAAPRPLRTSTAVYGPLKAITLIPDIRKA